MPANHNIIKFSLSPALEFACALYILANGRNCLSLSKEIGVEPDQLLLDMGDSGAKVFSRYMQKELSFFMELDTCSLSGTNPLNALPFLAALDNPDIESISELIKHIECSGDEYLLFLIAKSAIGLKSYKDISRNCLKTISVFSLRRRNPSGRSFWSAFIIQWKCGSDFACFSNSSMKMSTSHLKQISIMLSKPEWLIMSNNLPETLQPLLMIISGLI